MSEELGPQKSIQVHSCNFLKKWNETEPEPYKEAFVWIGDSRKGSQNLQGKVPCTSFNYSKPLFFLGGGFKHFLFSSLLGGDSHFD